MKEGFLWRDLTGSVDDDHQDVDSIRGALRIARAVLEELIDNLPVGIFCLDDRTNQFLLANREFESITQYSRKELAQLNYSEVLAPEDRERVAEMRRRRLSGDPSLPSKYEMLIITRHGDRRVVVFHSDVVPFKDIVLGVARDVTNEKLMVDPLLHTQRADSLASLAGGLASEFNNLLSVISGYAQLAITRSQQRPGLLEPLELIQEAVKQAVSQVNSLLSFARRGNNAMESVNIGTTLSELLSALPSMAPGGYTIRTENIGGARQVRGDASTMEQAFLNLLVNAVESLPNAVGNILVRCNIITIHPGESSELPPGRYSVISIADDGSGIALENQPRLFQPFFTTKNSQHHPGLGLSTSYGIIRNHGGTIQVTSTRGQGTTMKVLLPAERDPSQLVPAPIEPDSLPGAQSKPHILVVDDQEIVAELVADVLEASGFSAQFETSARNALQKIREGEITPDLIIVDIMMPDMDGRTLIRLLQKDIPQVPIVATSGYMAPQEGDNEISDLIRGFLKKPFRNDELVRLINDVLGQLPA